MSIWTMAEGEEEGFPPPRLGSMMAGWEEETGATRTMITR